MYRPFKSYDKRWGHPTCFSLWASSPGCSSSGAGKGRRACNYVSGIWILPPIPLWLPIDLAVRFSPISANVNKHCKHMPRVMMSLLMSPSANEHFASTFLMQIFKFQRRSCKLSFLFPPRRQGAPESFSQARETFDSAVYLLCFFEGSNKVFTNDFFDIFVRVTSLEKLSNQIGKCCYITQALG